MKLRGSLVLSATVCLGAAFLLSACDLPHAGPTAKELTRTDYPDINCVDLDMGRIAALARDTRLQELRHLRQTIIRLNGERAGRGMNQRVGIGDRISVQLVSFTSDGENTTMTPVLMRLGTFPVLVSGTVNLPYLHNVRVRGLTYAALQDRLSAAYKREGMFNMPAVIVQDADRGQQGDSRDAVLVTGELAHPMEVAWQAGGLTLAHALTQAMSYGDHNQEQAEGGKARTEYATTVTVIRHGRRIGSLALEDALEKTVLLMPGDKVVVRRQAPVKISVLGGGIRRPDVYGFSRNPTMAQLLASAGDLNPTTGKATNLFVFRQTGRKPTLYRLPYTRALGVFEVQGMLLQNDDVVYVAESPWVPYMQVFSMLMQAGFIASIAR